MKICSADPTCPNDIYVRGLCRSHYEKARRSGTLEDLALPSNHTPEPHKLSNKDADKRIATCSVCGPNTHIVLREPPNNWRCGSKKQYEYVYADSTSITASFTVSHSDRLQLLSDQGGKCAICKAPATSLDHCHTSGAIRGMLCQNCNLGLGLFGDSPDNLRAAIEYLTR